VAGERAVGGFMCGEERFQSGAERKIIGAFAIQKRDALGVDQRGGRLEQGFFA
jgi:hypothetical protein